MKIKTYAKLIILLAEASLARAAIVAAGRLDRALADWRRVPRPAPTGDRARAGAMLETIGRRAVARAIEGDVERNGVLVHADGGDCHGTPLVGGRCPRCSVYPDSQSTELWPAAWAGRASS